MYELKPENFEVAADRDGDMSLRCALYGEGCWWDADIRDGRPDADLGSLLEVAREHMRTAHATVIEAESQYLPDAAYGFSGERQYRDDFHRTSGYGGAGFREIET